MNNLAVVTMIENPLQWQSRYKNYWDFKRMLLTSGAVLYTVEVAYKDAPFIVTTEGCDENLQLRTDCEIWHKENAINLIVQRVKEDNIAWVDADIMFCNPKWAAETVKQLEHYKIVQMFSHAQNLGASFQPIGCVRPSYMYQYKTEGSVYGGINFWGKSKIKIPPERNAHPGLAWAASKQTISDLGGLIDWCIVGSGDFHMVAGFLGELTRVVTNAGYSDAYIVNCAVWESRCKEYVKKSVSYVPGLICHYWHGSSGNRKYSTYQNVLKELNYIPDLDIKRDWQGLYTLTNRNPDLRDAIQKYMRSRNEDEKGDILIP